MSEEELLKKYVNEVENLRKRARKLNLTDTEIDQLFQECFNTIKKDIKVSKKKHKAEKFFLFILKTLLISFTILIICYIVLNVHQPTASIVLRNVQSLIYPGFSLLRYLSVPIIKRFPSLTELYDESCLVENPFFYVYDMECWPCQNVYSVVDLSGFNNKSLYHSGIPYIFKSNQKYVTLKDIQDLYKNNKEIFDIDAGRLTSTDENIKSVNDLLNYTQNSKSSQVHISWRINRMVPARILRTLFPRPDIISEWSGQSVERYVMIDEPNAPHHILPSFECSYIFVIQGSGQQTIILKPTRECSGSCKTVSVTLKPSYVLWYNWWYWRPISLPMANATRTSISYINSYC